MDIKKMVEDRFNIETAKYTSTELGAKKGEIMEAVKNWLVEEELSVEQVIVVCQ